VATPFSASHTNTAANTIPTTVGGVSGSPFRDKSLLEEITPLLLAVLALAGLYLLRKG